MSRTTTEVYPGSWRQHFLLETDDGQYVPLIASDPSADLERAQVFKLDSTWKAKGRALKVELNNSSPFSSRRAVSADPSARAYLPPDTLAQTKMGPTYGYPGNGLHRREPITLDLAAIMRNQFPNEAAPCHQISGEANKKEYCTYWIRHGECDYMQQGCRYKHEMPDLVTLRKIGFRHTPDWHKEKMARRPLRTRSDVLQSILNRNTNDAASEADSDDSDATLAEVPHHLAVAPSTTPVQNTLVPAPSTFDLLSFDDDEDEPQLPKVPNNTPETSAYALPNLGPNRQGRFVPAGEELPRMSAPPLQPSPASSIVENKEEPKAIKPIYTPLARAAPVFNEYFKEQKATKSQEKLLLAKKEEEGSKSISNLESEKDAQIAKLQRKLAEVEAQRKLAESTAATKTPPTAPKSASPAPAPTLVVAAPISAKNGLLASKHSEGEVQAKGRSKSKAKDIQKPSEGATSKGRRLPAGRARKVATTKTGEKENVVAKK